ncbi:MAG: hypothetical protein AAFV53_03945 [Myxococcota bacterium]
MADLIHQALAALWDITLAVFPLALVQIWPDIFPDWVSLVGIPLLITRYRIAQLERSLVPDTQRTAR